MSKLNIKRLVSNIKYRTNIYTPIIEAIVNSIQSIEESGRPDGKIIIKVQRSMQSEMNFDGNALLDIESIQIEDNGIGFNEKNRDSFDTLYSDSKESKGGKGFGRFMFLKYFNSVLVESHFLREDGKLGCRKFNLGQKSEIVENEVISTSTEVDTKTVVSLNVLKDKRLEKQLSTVARKILEKILIYFINDKYVCPTIILTEEGGEDIILNEYLLSEKNSEIIEVKSESFELSKDEITHSFQAKIFQLFYPSHQKSKISLTAHNREVTDVLLHNYIPEFEDDFYEESEGKKRDYIIKTYVLGEYLDQHVSLEREDFDFSVNNELFAPFSQSEVEMKAAEITNTIFDDEVKVRRDKKINRIQNYIDEAPWNKMYFDDIDVSSIPYNFSDQDIEVEIHKIKYQQELDIKKKVNQVISDESSDALEEIDEIVKNISKSKMSDLARYVAMRKTILGLFKKSLEIKEDGAYESEDKVHSIIFPTREDSESLSYDDHNLWIIDEKLNFSSHISSDKPIEGKKGDRADLLIYNNSIALREDNNVGNPITIFEFKKPGRDNFADPSSKEEPTQQIIRYVNKIRAGKFKTPEGREIEVGDNTPFYGYVVADLSKKYRTLLKDEKDFKMLPDGRGYFKWIGNINLYIEVISWDKMLNDAEMRNKIFFQKLGI